MVHDRVGANAAGRFSMIALGWALSAYLGWQIVMKCDGGWLKLLGVALLLGIPVFVSLAIYNARRRQQIVEEVNAQYVEPDRVAFEKIGARRTGETPAAWLDRVLPPELAKHRGYWDGYAAYRAPAVGETFLEWGARIPPDFPARVAARSKPDMSETGWREGEAIAAWAERASAIASQVSGADAREIEQTCRGLAQYVRPMRGEKLDDYVKRASARLQLVDHSVDLAGSSSAIDEGETLAEWLSRVGYLCIAPREDQCIEEVIERLGAVGRFTPPEPGESALSWTSRVLPLLGSK